MMTLYQRFADLKEGEHIIFNTMKNKRIYKVVTNHVDDVLYFFPIDEKDAGFHLFYDSIIEDDNFTLASEIGN